MSRPVLFPAHRASSVLVSKTNSSPRTFHTSPATNASILFALQGLSNSRETQHFNKLSRLSRVEHSPSLKLIQTGEVEAFPLPSQPRPTPPSTLRPLTASTASTTRLWDAKALRVGRAVLTENARHAAQLTRQLRRAKRRQAQQAAVMEKERLVWRKETARLRGEMRVAGFWIVGTIGAATVLACWRFWPQRSSPDSAVLASGIAEAAVSSSPSGPRAAPVLVEPVLVPPPGVVQAVSEQRTRESSWWHGLFWKQQ